MDFAGDARSSFDEVADIYEAVRPGYPGELFDRLFAVLPTDPAIVEVGPGTGQATVDLLRRGARVTAVEAGPHLAAAVASRFGDHPALRVVNATFEDADLPRGGFDAVFAATAHHWVEESQRIRRPPELLDANGVLAIIDLIQVEATSDGGYFERVQPIYESFGRHRPHEARVSYDTATPAIVEQVAAAPEFGDVEIHRVPWDQTYTALEYRDLMLTFSSMRTMPVDRRDDLVAQLVVVVVDEFGGSLTRPLVATLTMARATAR